MTLQRDVVFAFGLETWAEARQRGYYPPDQLAETLLTHPGIRGLVVADAYRSAAVVAAKRLARRAPPAPAADRRVVTFRPRRLRRRDPTGLRALTRAYRAYEAGLQRAAASAGMERPALITTSPMLAGLASLDWAEPVTFYAWDDWPAHYLHRRWSSAYEEVYAGIRARGRRVCAVSGAVLERIAPIARHAVVPNGVDPGEWECPEPPPQWFAKLPPPRLLYVGMLDRRIDTELVRRTAEAFAGGSVTLAGPLLDSEHLARLEKLPNVRLVRPLSRPEVAAVVSAADACLVPHTRTPLTQAMSPLKLYEYLAAGRPVAAVDLPPLRGIDSRVFVAESEESFPAAVSAALRAGPAPELERRAFLTRNAWQGRHEAILDLALH